MSTVLRLRTLLLHRSPLARSPSAPRAPLEQILKGLPRPDEEGAAYQRGRNPEFDSERPVAPFGSTFLHRLCMTVRNIVGKR